jgi:hypothetical protein
VRFFKKLAKNTARTADASKLHVSRKARSFQQ